MVVIGTAAAYLALCVALNDPLINLYDLSGLLFGSDTGPYGLNSGVRYYQCFKRMRNYVLGLENGSDTILQ